MKLQRNHTGFTLVEIMIVVAIIGLLAAIAVPNFAQARNNARTGACVNNLRLIDAAKEQYALENNIDEGEDASEDNVSTYLKGGAMPECPAAGNYTVGAIGDPPTCDVDGHELVAAEEEEAEE